MYTRNTYIYIGIYRDRIHYNYNILYEYKNKKNNKSTGLYRRITVSSVSVDDGVVIKRLIWQVLHYSQVFILAAHKQRMLFNYVL